MGLDKYIEVPVGEEIPPLELDDSYIDRGIVKLFQIDILGLIKIKASLGKQFHIQPSEIDKMPFWEYEFYLEALNDMVTEENDAQQKEMDKYKINEMMSNANPKNIGKTMQQAQPKMPNFSNMSMPSMKL